MLLRKPLFNKVTIVGLGLMGGSLGLAIKKYRLASQVKGFSRRRKTLLEAKRLGAIDLATLNLKQALYDADLIILATPVSVIIELLPKIFKFVKAGCIVIDVGSTKFKIIRTAEENIPKDIFFVGVHPLAGSEKKGIEFAKHDIFKNSLCILTPTKNTQTIALKQIKKLWIRLGARIKILKPQEHDRIIAFVSHLPHILSFSLMDAIPNSYLSFSSSGLKSTTRIASSSPTIWRDICLSNSKSILIAVTKFERSLLRIKKLIQNKESRLLEKLLQQAKIKRDVI